MSTKITEDIIVTFFAICAVRFLSVCIGRKDEGALAAAEEAEPALLKNIRDNFGGTNV